MHPNADALASGVVQPQVEQGLAGVVVGLATGNQTKTVIRTFDDGVVDFVGADVSQCGIPFVIEQTRFLAERVVGPTNMQATFGHNKLRQHNFHTLGVDHHRGAGLHHLLNGFHARPHACKSAHGNAMDAVVQHVLHRRREKHRQATGFENMVALVRSRAAFGDVVVTGQSQHAAPRRGARHIGVLENIRGTVNAWAFAIPNAKNAIEFVAARGRKAQLLRPPQSGGGKLFIHTGLENDLL